MAMLGWFGDNGDPDNYLGSLLGCPNDKPTEYNAALFCNAAFESLLQRAKRATEVQERTKLYEAAQRIFQEQSPWFTIAHSVQFKPVRKEVSNVVLSPFGIINFYNVDINK